MNEPITQYDAFISYRHSELDKFVAVTLHKKLEAFRPPKGICSALNGKKKIERVFRDQDELPLSSNLSDPINLALENSDFLIVICTPRLPESEWCKREIETFIKLHGRDRILAVLAEGEPEESFPDALVKEEYEVVGPDGKKETKIRNLEPLAADVRGKNKKEIKKAIDDAVIRITAAIFGINYDALKQRHKERQMKRTISTVSMVAGAFMLFSAVCIWLMAKIVVQSEMIMQQNDEIKQQAEELHEKNEQIKAQFLEMQTNYAIATATESADLMSKGKQVEAVDSLRQVMPASLDDTSYPYTTETEYALSDSLELYGDDALLYHKWTFDSESTIILTKVSQDGKKVMTYDSANNLHVWSVETGEELFHKACTVFSTNKRGSCTFITNDSILYSDNKSIIRHNFSDNSEKTIYTDETSAAHPVQQVYGFNWRDYYIIENSGECFIYNRNTDELVFSKDFQDYYADDETPFYTASFSSIAVSKDNKYLIAVVEYVFSENLDLFVIDIENSELIHREKLPGTESDLILSIDNTFYIPLNNQIFQPSDDSYVYAFDLDTLEKKWLFSFKNDVCNPNISGDNSIYYISSKDYVYSIDSNTGELLKEVNTNSDIVGIFAFDYSNSCAVMTKNCKYFMYRENEYSLVEKPIFNHTPSLNINIVDVGDGDIFINFENTTYLCVYTNRDRDDRKTVNSDAAPSFSLSNDGSLYIQRTYEDSTNCYSVYSIDSETPLYSFTGRTSAFDFVGDNNEKFVTISNSGYSIYNTSDGSLIYSSEDDYASEFFKDSPLSYDRKYTASYNLDTATEILEIKLFDLETNRIVKSTTINNIKNYATFYLLDENTFALRDDYGVVNLYNFEDSKPIYTIDRELASYDYFVICSNKKVFLTAYADGTIQYYSYENSEIELFKTENSMILADAKSMIYYPEEGLYFINTLHDNTLIVNDNFEPLAYTPYVAGLVKNETGKYLFYIDSYFHEESYSYKNKFALMPFYDYNGLIKKADEFLAQNKSEETE